MSSDMESKMQDYMEAGEQEYNDLCVSLKPPVDWRNPDWSKAIVDMDWKIFVPTVVASNWLEMSGRDRLITAAGFAVVVKKLTEVE